jgi:quercetin dioxygenase-like cupin family protein
MRRLAASFAVCVWFCATLAESAEVTEPSGITVAHSGSQDSAIGGMPRFTGAVRIDPLFQSAPPSRLSGGQVTFAPGARTAWHTHPLGQTLIVTSGKGWVQQWGQPRQQIVTGDVVSIPAGVKHWHGATSTTGMTHIALQEAHAGKNVEWLERVTDDQYR